MPFPPGAYPTNCQSQVHLPESKSLVDLEDVHSSIMLTIFLSVLAHGISAAPLTNWYAKRIAQFEKDGVAQAETKFVPGMPTRNATITSGSVSSEREDGSQLP